MRKHKLDVESRKVLCVYGRYSLFKGRALLWVLGFRFQGPLVGAGSVRTAAYS